MQNTFILINLIKNLLVFGLSFLIPWVVTATAFQGHSGQTAAEIPLDGQIARPLMLPAEKSEESLFTWASYKMNADKSSWLEALFTNYLWFIIIMLLFEIIIEAWKKLNKYSKHTFNEQTWIQGKAWILAAIIQQQQKRIKHSTIDFVIVLMKFVASVFRKIFVSTLCYLIFLMVFAVLHFCISDTSIYESQVPAARHINETFFIEHLGNRNLHQEEEQVTSGLLTENMTIERTKLTDSFSARNERFLTASLSTPMVSSYYQNEDIISDAMVFSRYSSIVFFLASQNSWLQIMNFTHNGSPEYLGNVTLSESSSARRSLSLSPDEKSIFVVGSDQIQIINISNLSSPASITLVTAPESTSFQLFSISSNGQSAFITISTNQLIIMDISNITSPQQIQQISYNSTSISNLSLHDENMYLTANGNIYVYDITNLTNPPVLITTLSFGYPASLVFFGIDFQTAFVYNGYKNWEIYNISNNTVSSPMGSIAYQIVSISPDGIHIFTSSGGTALSIMDISDPYLPKMLGPIPAIYNFNEVVSSADGRTIASGDGPLALLELNINVEAPKQVLNMKNSTFIIQQNMQLFAISSDSNILYGSCENEGTLCILDISNPLSYFWLPNITISQNLAITQMTISPDSNSFFFALGSDEWELNPLEFQIYDVSLGQSVYSINISLSYANFESFTTTRDSERVLLFESETNFLILDTSDPANVSILSNNSFSPSKVIPLTILLSNDEKTAFILSGYGSVATGGSYSNITIYDISNPAAPNIVALVTNISGSATSVTLSTDGNTIFIFSYAGACILSIIDISTLNAPTFIHNIMSIQAESCKNTVMIPILQQDEDQDETQLLFSNLGNISALFNVSIPTSPELLTTYDFIPVIDQMMISPDNNTLYITSSSGDIFGISLFSEYILLLDEQDISLGFTYTSAPNVLQRNSRNTYDTPLLSYKYSDIALYYPPSSIYAASSYATLPNWIDFDQNSGLITFAPNSQSLIGTYYISANISTQILNNTFLEAGLVDNSDDSLDLFITLVFLGYIDNGGYLTSSFDSGQPLLLSKQYQANETQLRQTLANYSVPAYTTIFIKSSLIVTIPPVGSPLLSPITINTQSLYPVTLFISLLKSADVADDENDNDDASQQRQPRFVSIGYSFAASFSNDNTTISMLSSSTDLNTALSELIIFINGSTTDQYCDANVTIVDDLNPNYSQIIPNISQYFRVSSIPSIDLSYFQSQLTKISPKTGEQFVFQLDQSTFSDSNNQPLSLSLQMLNPSLQVPDWLETKGYIITGVPLEQLTGRTLELILVVSNQYQANQIDFTLDIDISLAYGLKLIGSYGSLLLTIIGLFVYATHIYNVFGKRFYTYSKRFHIRPGQEITPKTIYPIILASEPIAESRIIMRSLDKKMSRKLRTTSKAQIAIYFTNQTVTDPSSTTTIYHQIDRTKLVQVIEETASDISREDQTKLNLYTSSVSTSQKELINQLIINNFIMRLLGLPQEKPTKRAFDLIKRDLFSLVDLEAASSDELSCRFTVNKARLYSKLREYQIKSCAQPSNKEEEEKEIDLLSIASSVVGMHHSGTDLIVYHPKTKETQISQAGLEAVLVNDDDNNIHVRSFKQTRKSTDVTNVDLLIDIIEAYAFNHHTIDAHILDVDVIAKKKISKKHTCVWPIENIRRFLKLDLQRIGFIKKTMVGYGIEYITQGDSIRFYGTATEKVKDKVLVVQIINQKGKILRELWLYGINNDDESDERKNLSDTIL